jgi:hypothetical protein
MYRNSLSFRLASRRKQFKFSGLAGMTKMSPLVPGIFADSHIASFVLDGEDS